MRWIFGIPANNFDVILSGKEDLRSLYGDRGVNKPYPYIYEVCAKKLKLDPQKCLVFEDTDAGVAEAIGAKMAVIATPNAFTERHSFQGSIAIRTFKNMKLNEFVSPFSSTLEFSMFRILEPVYDTAGFKLATRFLSRL